MLIVSINVLPKKCINCGAPLTEPICLYCDTDYGVRRAVPKPPAQTVSAHQFGIRLQGHQYQVLGQIAKGQHSRVLLARRRHLVKEQIVLKVSDRPELLEQEWSTLRHLEGRCSYLARLMPIPLELIEVRGRRVLAFPWRSGFVHTLEYVRAQYPQGLPPEAAVWIWNRILEQLSSLHDLGYSHNNLSLEHCLVHPRHHGIALCGWSESRLGEGQDLAASGRLVGQLLGKNAPEPMKELANHAHQFYEPEHLLEELRRVARSVFGPPKFHPFVLR